MLSPKLISSACICFTILALSCTRRPLIPKDNNSEAERNNHLFVFVGEKIEVNELKQEVDSWDGKFYAKYKILQKVYGDYDDEVIEFTAYDHYGIPGFSNYKNSLLFVSKHKDKFFQEKYQYYDVYKTKSDRWAGRYSVPDFGRDGGECYGVKPEKIDFQEPVSFLLSDVEDQNKIDCWFPQPYYKLDSVKATAVYGNYIEDLFKIKKDGVLKARGFFGEMSDGLLHVEETQLAEILSTDETGRKEFYKFLDSFTKSLDKSKASSINLFTLDTLLIDNKPADQKELFRSGFFTSDFISALRENDKTYPSIRIVDSTITARTYFKRTVKKAEDRFVGFHMEIIKETVRSNKLMVDLGFVKTKNGFKLYSFNQFNRSICYW